MNIKILVATHKQCEMPEDSVYLPVHVGKELHPNRGYGYQTDNEGMNISHKNLYYSELTAIYWSWKNLKVDYIGLAHYRRHFCSKRKDNDWNSILTGKEAEDLFKKYDIILSRRQNLYIETVYSHYDYTFWGEQFDCAREIISRRYV